MTLTPTLQIAFDILNDNKQAMHVNDIAANAVKLNKNMGMNESELASKLSSALSTHLKTKTPIFAKVANKNGTLKKGIYRLKRQMVKAPIAPIPKYNELSTGYTGKAGEYAVMSELLFWGFNVSLMAVDEGIDIVAAKDNKYFHIQVKATTERVDATHFVFTIKKDVFLANHNNSTFYILVLRYINKTQFIVLPSSHIHTCIGHGKIKGDKSYSLRVHFDEKKKRFILNNTEDLSPHCNAFDQIK